VFKLLLILDSALSVLVSRGM